MSLSPESKRVAYTPGEFAAFCGKSQTWGYRQISEGKINAHTKHGRILIPAVEVDNILQSAGIYDGLPPKPPKSSAKPSKNVALKRDSAWKAFVEKRRQIGQSSAAVASASPTTGRKAVLARLTRKRVND